MKLENIATNYKNNTKIIKEQQSIAREILKFLEDNDNNGLLAGGAPRNWHYKIPARDLDIYVYEPINLEKLKNTFTDVDTKEVTKSLSYGVSSDGLDIRTLLVENNPTKSLEDIFDSIDEANANEYLQSQNIENVISLNILGMDIQFIQMKKDSKIRTPNKYNKNMPDFVRYVFNSFDFGICKIGCQLKNWGSNYDELYEDQMKNPGFYTFESVDFLRDYNEKKLTIRAESISQKNLILELIKNKTCKRYEKIINYFPNHKIDIIIDKEAYIGK